MNILNISRKLAECNAYIGQLETQNQLLRQHEELAKKSVKASQQASYEQRKEAYLLPIREMTAFLASHYEFRHNVVRDSYELRRRDSDEPWLPLDERQMNSVMNSVQDEGRVYCLKSLVVQRIKSSLATDYHPVTAYLEQVRGRWDGTDRVSELISRVNPSDYCRRMMRLWLRAVVAQWLGHDARHANAVMLLLVSPRQGLHKSTFLHELLPEQLADYYTDDYSLSSRSNAERKLVEFALVNIDEFDKLPPKKMPDLKTLMQTLRPSFVKAYKTNFNLLPRIASFVGTSNQRQLLTDRTGSRRFLILEPESVIRVAGIDHDQLYAQLIHEVESGLPCHFTKADEAEMELHNQPYYVVSDLERLVLRFFRRPEEGEACQELSARQLMNILQKHNGRLLREESETHFGRLLLRLGFDRIHNHLGNVYRVVLL